MDTHIRGQAAAAREQARQGDGKFGQQTFARASIDLEDPVDPTEALDWPDGFDPHTAPPTSFDEQLRIEHETLADARRRLETVNRRLRTLGGRRAGDSPQDDEAAAAEALRRASSHGTAREEPDAALAGDLLNERTFASLDVAMAQSRVDALDDTYQARGTWKRAFLVTGPDGHVHSSMSCSTCRPTTRYAWMTGYSGANEDTIVSDVGYRACTTCYPSAPAGDSIRLPTKMLTDEEKTQAEKRQQEATARTAKRAQAASNAPTASGEPIEIRYPTGKHTHVETLKTERAAQQWVTSHLVDDAFTRSLDHTPNVDPQKQQIEREAADRILDELAAKRGVDRTVIADEIRQKALAKAKRDHKASLKQMASLNLPVDADAEDRHARTLEHIRTAWT